MILEYRKVFLVKVIPLLLASLMGSVQGQGLPERLYIKTSQGLLDPDGALLSGTSSASVSWGVPFVEGALVHVINPGLDGKANRPIAASSEGVVGMPDGDDSLIRVSAVGENMIPYPENAGRISLSIYPKPTIGTKLYVRVFNAETLATSTAWGQSIVFEITDKAVIDVSQLGLWGTIQAVGVEDPSATDSDFDGLTDEEEWIANTSAVNAEDGFYAVAASVHTAGVFDVSGYAGRRYTLLRTTEDLTQSPLWFPVASTDTLLVDETVVLQDPQPPSSKRGFYKISVSMPE